MLFTVALISVLNFIDQNVIVKARPTLEAEHVGRTEVKNFSLLAGKVGKGGKFGVDL
jgi:hypothetical protein